MKYAIFGDVGGHFRPFKNGLKSVGVDVKNMAIPDGLTIIQLGDLVHKGPNSTMVVDMVNRMMRANPGKWIQLAGNHELPYVMNHFFFYRDKVDAETERRIVSWITDGLIHPSHAFADSKGRQYLVTHAGLSKPNHVLHGGGDAFSISQSLNSTDWAKLAKSGTMLNGSYPNPEAGIFWAEGVSEVYSSWHISNEVAPFDQVHGHSSFYLWDKCRPRFNYAPWVADNMVKDFKNMRTTYTVNGMHFHGIDHGLGTKSFTDIIKPIIIE